jgi:hypothetical protein
MQTPAEAFGQVNDLLVAQQSHDIPQAVVHSRAMSAVLKMSLNLPA